MIRKLVVVPPEDAPTNAAQPRWLPRPPLHKDPLRWTATGPDGKRIKGTSSREASPRLTIRRPARREPDVVTHSPQEALALLSRLLWEAPGPLSITVLPDDEP